MLSTNTLTQVKNIFNKLSENDEFEIIFNNYKSDNKLSLIKFMDALKYIRYRSDRDGLRLINETTLDIGYNYDNLSVYRITVNGNTMINQILNLVHTRRNHIIFSILVTQFLKDENVKFINKIKDSKNVIDLDSYDIRIRKSTEEPLKENKLKELTNIPITDCDKIFYRYKQRISLFLLDEEKEKIRIDLTVIKSASNPNDLQTESGWTALIGASNNGYTECVRLLLQAGGKTNLQTENGWTALMRASKYRRIKIVKILKRMIIVQILLDY